MKRGSAKKMGKSTPARLGRSESKWQEEQDVGRKGLEEKTGQLSRG